MNVGLELYPEDPFESSCWIAQLVAHWLRILGAGGSRPGRGVNSVRLTTGGYCCGWRHSGGGGGVGGDW